jgi:hypothetical protein
MIFLKSAPPRLAKPLPITKPASPNQSAKIPLGY